MPNIGAAWSKKSEDGSSFMTIKLKLTPKLKKMDELYLVALPVKDGNFNTKTPSHGIFWVGGHKEKK